MRTAYDHLIRGVEEVVALDIGASVCHASDMLHIAHGVSLHAGVPVTVGGGVRLPGMVLALLGSGADKVSINTRLACGLSLLPTLATRHGSQCLVGCVDARIDPGSMAWQAKCRGGCVRLSARLQDWVSAIARQGAGEVVLTSIDRDGTRCGFDVPLAHSVASGTQAPLVVSGGAGGVRDCLDAAGLTAASGVLLAGALHDGTVGTPAIRAAIRYYGPYAPI